MSLIEVNNLVKQYNKEKKTGGGWSEFFGERGRIFRISRTERCG